VKPRSKFALGGLLVLSTATYLMASSISETAVYYLTPNELAAKVATDPSFYDTGIKVGGRVVRGSIEREAGGRSVRFVMADSTGAHRYPVSYRGVIPDTFTDDVDVVVEGRLARDGTFQATTLLAKCGSRYENAPERPGEGGHPADVPRGTGGYGAPAAVPSTPAGGQGGAGQGGS
jgi:cytochrome c-type biogenesis protein CcmE